MRCPVATPSRALGTESVRCNDFPPGEHTALTLGIGRSARGGGIGLYYPRLKVGTFSLYFPDAPALNKNNEIEDDSRYGVANGYGTVAPVAMKKKGPKTGEMVKLESEALKDDLLPRRGQSGRDRDCRR